MTTPRPLDGVRVVSLAQQYPGPYATLILSDLGADVLQVEHPGGDPARRHPEFYQAINRNKSGICLDLKNPAQRERLFAELDDCDVFLEGFKPGTAERLGVSYAQISPRFPQIVYVSISAFGQTGPYRDRPAHDLSIQAMSGYLHGREHSALEPPYVGHGDLVAGVFAAVGALSGLHSRKTTGKGSYIDISMADCMVSWMTGVIAPVVNGAQPNEPDFPAYGLFQSRDGKWLSLSVIEEDHFWRGLTTAIERPELQDLSFEERNSRRRELRGVIADCFSAHDFAELANRLDHHGVAWAPVLSPQEVLDNEHFQARGLFKRINDEGSSFVHVSTPIHWNGQALPPRRGAPKLD